MSPRQPRSKYGAVRGPAPAPPPRSPNTVLTTVPSRAEKSEQPPSCSPQQQGEDDQGRYVQVGFADSQPQNLPRALARRSVSLRQPGLPKPYPALPDSDAQSCPSPSMKAPASPQEGAGHRQQQQMQPAMAASARRTEMKDDVDHESPEAPSTFYMPRGSSSMPRAASRWAKSLLYSGNPVNSSKPEHAEAQSGSPRMMIIDSRISRMDRCEDVDEFVVPPAPQRPPRRRRKGSRSQQETQKLASYATSPTETSKQLNRSSSWTGSQSNENTANHFPLPVPKPRRSQKSKSKSTATTSPPITATTNAIKNPKQDSHGPARQTPVPPPKTYLKEKPARPPPPTAPTRKNRPPPPVPIETKASMSHPLSPVSSPACADGSKNLYKIATADTTEQPLSPVASPKCIAGSTNLYKITDVARQPSISSGPNDDPDYTYIDIRNARKLLKAREHKHRPLLGDSDSDGEVGEFTYLICVPK